LPDHIGAFGAAGERWSTGWSRDPSKLARGTAILSNPFDHHQRRSDDVIGWLLLGLIAEAIR
jgi:hypothetical protein